MVLFILNIEHSLLISSKSLFSRVVLHLFTGSLVGIGKLRALAGQYIRFGIFCTVRFGRSSILWNFAGTPFCKFCENVFFPQKGGLIYQKVGRSLPLREKRGSRQMYNTKTSRPSFPSVSVGKIPGKHQPTPNRNTELGYNSTLFNSISKNNYWFWREKNPLCAQYQFLSAISPTNPPTQLPTNPPTLRSLALIIELDIILWHLTNCCSFSHTFLGKLAYVMHYVLETRTWCSPKANLLAPNSKQMFRSSSLGY